MELQRLLTIIRFGVTGSANTVLGLGTIFLLRQFVPDLLANFLAFCVVVPISFLSHRNWSFRDGGELLPAFLRYLPTVAMGYACNVAILWGCLANGVMPELAQVAGITGYVLLTYLISESYVFREKA